MAIIIDGKKVAEELKNKIKIDLEILANTGIVPCLHTILVGDDPASKVYVGSKHKSCSLLGIKSENHNLPENTSSDSLMQLIEELNRDRSVHGILVQLPLPKEIDRPIVCDKINPLKDVDGFSYGNITKLYRGQNCLEPCTPKGILALLDSYNLVVEGKNVVIIGRSEIVGKPLSLMMSGRNATTTLCHSRTKNLQEYTKRADIVVSAIGRPKYLTGEFISEGAVVIDVGINRISDSSSKGYQIVGDVDFESVSKKAGYITPVPGGVGPMTIVSLMENTVKACKLQTS